MRHAREDYNRFQDPENKIPEDEPVFILRAQDVAAPDTLRYWARIASRAGAKKDITDKAIDWADEMQQWRTKKVPDMP